MSGQNDHLYYGYGYHPNTGPPVVQPPPHHSFQQDHTLFHHPAAPLHAFSQNHMHIQQVSAGVESQDIHDKIQVEQPIKKTRRRRGEAAAERAAAQAAAAGNNPRPARSNPHPGVVIKTKFPVARIKRIMQADEDVGKVAQVTPVIVSKALELFMIALCAKASEQARARNSKRITASHLKQAVMADEQFDFLEEIMAKVPDVPLAAESSNQGNGSDEETNGGAPGSAKKPRKPRTRKPKDEDSY